MSNIKNELIAMRIEIAREMQKEPPDYKKIQEIQSRARELLRELHDELKDILMDFEKERLADTCAGFFSMTLGENSIDLVTSARDKSLKWEDMMNVIASEVRSQMGGGSNAREADAQE